MPLFNNIVRALLPKMNREHININNNDAKCGALKTCQDKYVKDNDSCNGSLSFPIGSMVGMQDEDVGTWTHGVIK